MKCSGCSRPIPKSVWDKALVKKATLRCSKCGAATKTSKLSEMLAADPDFDGPAYDPSADKRRLTGQIQRVFDAMKDGIWRTLEEIADATRDPHASISAQLRHLRKLKFGAYTVEKRHRGEPASGLWEYRVLV